jgi:hypothetical protein
MIDNPPPFPDDVVEGRAVMESFMGAAPLVDGTTVHSGGGVALAHPSPWLRARCRGDVHVHGTFPVLRATSHRKGDSTSPYGRVQNLARVRVVVT